MASCRNISYAPHSKGAETHVTNSQYGYCSSVDHGEVYTRPNYHGNYPLQAMYGQSPSTTWQLNMFGQPSHDPYGQWEGNFQNIAIYNSNNNIIHQAPPTKTVLIHPKFMSKDCGSKVDVDPTHVRLISHIGLIRKYIDYLLMENDYITEISKAVSLPMDNCVMEDPYIMYVIRVKIPFPTPKYMQLFLKDFYPPIDWKALNHQLDKYRSGGDGAEKFHSYYLDNCAVPVLLGEAFYFFQREGDRKVMEEK
ncbi:unnamed protein product [Mytilus coruscus]|uniref:Uncharacterized protein n=1 Tax=Mytilus coruscus TaxID=42192 RepID=A0A6J8DSR2_MYTCO|nr:unnamed protein product [Mytilus coruscus]